MFVEAIRRELKVWPRPSSGIAALSFTNVARQTIETRVGTIVAAPHYTGTLDAFVFRFIVKPFAHLVGLPQGAVRLFPASLCDELDKPDVQIGPNPAARAPLFKTYFTGAADKEPSMRASSDYGTRPIPQDLVKGIWEAKQAFWKKTGIVTHSDCHFLASSILKHKTEGARVRDLLSRRFPTIFIDELQDTGFFLARAFVKLCEHPAIRVLVVGDPNQAIYGFGGASSTIFDDFEKLDGSQSFKLSKSQRCPTKVAALASALTSDKTIIDAREDAPQGTTTLVVHNLDQPKLSPAQAKFLKNLQPAAKFALIARRSRTASELKAQKFRNNFAGKSSAGRQLSLAVEKLRNNAVQDAAVIVDRELCRVLLNNPTAGAEDLVNRGLNLREWRAAIFRVLSELLRQIDGETWNDWVIRAKSTVQALATDLRIKPEELQGLKSYRICNEKGGALRNQLLDVPVAQLWSPDDTVTTVHRVKGAEFETVVFFNPKPGGKRSPCISKEWWKADGDGEERRIAFVAVSRAKQNLVLCLHKKTLEALQNSQPEFVALFGQPVPLPMGA